MAAEAERLAYLEAMGIDTFFLRRAGTREAPEEAGPGAADPAASDVAASEMAESAVSRPAAVATPVAASPAAAAPAGTEPAAAAHETFEYALLGWSELEQAVAGCTRCRLHEGRTQTVFGVGSREAEWMVIGEAPGAEEDRRGEPFVGRAGQLLDQMLRAVGLERDSVFIANILKCRPPGNRDPGVEEANACRGYLERQIALVKPRLILAVGRIAAQQLLRTDAPLGRLRGQAHVLQDSEIPVIVTYHPAYLLRSPTQKAKAWQDLCLARSILRDAGARAS